MFRKLGAATPAPSAPTAPTPSDPGAVAGSAAISPAVRDVRPGWRDPRLWMGVAIIAGSVLLGVRVVASADDTVRVWAAASDLGPGQRVGEGDLVPARVHFADVAGLAGYFRVEQPLPAGLELTRGVGAGELLPRSAAGPSGRVGLLELPLALDPEQVPRSVHEGAVVDVYVVTPPSAGARPSAGGPAIAAATVLDAPGVTTAFGATGRRQLVLGVPEAAATAFFTLLSQYDAPVLTVLRRG